MPCSQKKGKWCPIATCSFIKETKQTAGAMKGVMRYVSRNQKTLGIKRTETVEKPLAGQQSRQRFLQDRGQGDEIL